MSSPLRATAVQDHFDTRCHMPIVSILPKPRLKMMLLLGAAVAGLAVIEAPPAFAQFNPIGAMIGGAMFGNQRGYRAPRASRSSRRDSDSSSSSSDSSSSSSSSS